MFKKDKHAMTHELGIQIRDLRLLDPLMTSSYPSCLLCRDKALIVNLEYVPSRHFSIKFPPLMATLCALF